MPSHCCKHCSCYYHHSDYVAVVYLRKQELGLVPSASKTPLHGSDITRTGGGVVNLATATSGFQNVNSSLAGCLAPFLLILGSGARCEVAMSGLQGRYHEPAGYLLPASLGRLRRESVMSRYFVLRAPEACSKQCRQPLNHRRIFYAMSHRPQASWTTHLEETTAGRSLSRPCCKNKP